MLSGNQQKVVTSGLCGALGSSGNSAASRAVGKWLEIANSTGISEMFLMAVWNWSLTDSSSATAGGQTRQKEPACPRRSLERVVRPAPTERTNVDQRGAGGRVMGAAGRKGRTEEATCRKEGRADGMARARTGVGWLNGNPRAARQQRISGSGPNDLKLSDRHRRSKAKQAEKTRTPVPVRWSARLGRPPTEGLWKAATKDVAGRAQAQANDLAPGAGAQPRATHHLPLALATCPASATPTRGLLA